MILPPLHAATRPLAAGRFAVLAPAVGLWRVRAKEGFLLTAGQEIGEIIQLGKSRRVLLSDDAPGGRAVSVPGDRIVAVDFGSVLFQLESAPAIESSGRAAGPAAGDERGHLVRSPTDGVFYRKPSPDAPPFVEVGHRIRTGEPVGLVEVMKTFNQIQYGGDDLPDRAEVVEILCEDGEDVRAGQALLRVR